MNSLKKLGKYEILKPLGSGGMGSVYLAKDTLIGRFVAIKTLNLEIGEELEKSDVESFFNEAKVAGTLIHPSIVTIFDAGIENGIPYIVMEFFDGISLSKFLETREFTTKEKLEILKRIGEAIDFAHSKGVIHRDIKPANILINDKREVKIADFGIARIISSQKLKQSVAIGTPAYIAPEQAIGEAIDQRADIFSFAVVAYELLSGVAPFLGNDYNSTLYNVLYAEPRETRRLKDAGIDEEKWKKVFERALSKRPEKRFSTAKDLVDALEEVMISDRLIKPLKQTANIQVETRTLRVSRRKLRASNLFFSIIKPLKSVSSATKNFFANLSVLKMAPIIALILIAISILVIFILTPGKKEEKKVIVSHPVKIVEETPVKEEPPPPSPPEEPVSEQPQEIILQIFSDPPHAKVFVDGVEKGETPLFIPGIGKSEITLRLERAGYIPVTRKITIDPSQGDIRVKINLKSVEAISMDINVISEPEGAKVFINGKIVGTTPLKSYPLPYGTYQIAIEKDGYKTKYDEIKVFKGGKQTLSFTLEPVPKIEERRLPVEGELIEMSEKVVRPKKISGEYPTTPPNFRKKGRFSVALSFIVDEKGDVKEIILEKSSGEPELDLAAAKALRAWKFTPPTLEGVKVKIRNRQIFTFVIE